MLKGGVGKKVSPFWTLAELRPKWSTIERDAVAYYALTAD